MGDSGWQWIEEENRLAAGIEGFRAIARAAGHVDPLTSGPRVGVVAQTDGVVHEEAEMRFRQPAAGTPAVQTLPGRVHDQRERQDAGQMGQDAGLLFLGYKITLYHKELARAGVRQAAEGVATVLRDAAQSGHAVGNDELIGAGLWQDPREAGRLALGHVVVADADKIGGVEKGGQDFLHVQAERFQAEQRRVLPSPRGG